MQCRQGAQNTVEETARCMNVHSHVCVCMCGGVCVCVHLFQFLYGALCQRLC